MTFAAKWSLSDSAVPYFYLPSRQINRAITSQQLSELKRRGQSDLMEFKLSIRNKVTGNEAWLLSISQSAEEDDRTRYRPDSGGTSPGSSPTVEVPAHLWCTRLGTSPTPVTGTSVEILVNLWRYQAKYQPFCRGTSPSVEVPYQVPNHL